MKEEKEHKWQFYVIFTIIGMQFYDSFSSELYSRLQSLYLTEYLVDGYGMTSDRAVACLNNSMLPCYLFIMLAPVFRALADRYGRRKLLIANVIGIGLGVGICAKAPSFIVFMLGNMILNFSDTLDVQNFYILEEIPKKRQGLMKGISIGGSMLAAVSISALRRYFVGTGTYGWRNLYTIAMAFGMVMLVWVLGMPESRAFQITRQEIDQSEKQKSHGQNLKKIWNRYGTLWFENKPDLVLILLFGVATAGVMFYNEPMLRFGGVKETDVEWILAIQAITSCIVMTAGGWFADWYGKRKAAFGLLVAAMVGAVVFIGMSGLIRVSGIVGFAFGCMTGGFWGAYYLLELNLLERMDVTWRGEGSAVLTYIYGVGNAIGILLCTALLQLLSLVWMKLILTLPVLVMGNLLLRRGKREGTIY